MTQTLTDVQLEKADKPTVDKITEQIKAQASIFGFATMRNGRKEIIHKSEYDRCLKSGEIGLKSDGINPYPFEILSDEELDDIEQKAMNGTGLADSEKIAESAKLAETGVIADLKEQLATANKALEDEKAKALSGGTPDEVVEKPLNRMNLSELREKAKTLDIVLEESATKAQITEAIEKVEVPAL